MQRIRGGIPLTPTAVSDSARCRVTVLTEQQASADARNEHHLQDLQQQSRDAVSLLRSDMQRSFAMLREMLEGQLDEAMRGVVQKVRCPDAVVDEGVWPCSRPGGATVPSPERGQRVSSTDPRQPCSRNWQRGGRRGEGDLRSRHALPGRGGP